MLKINLLPIEQKQKLKLYFIYGNIIGSGLFLLLLTLILIIFLALFLAFLDLRFYFIGKEIINEQNKIAQTETIKGIEKKVRTLNAEINNLDKLQQNQSKYYQIIFDISQNLLSGVRVQTLEIEKDTGKITITGFSSTREALLAIKNTLGSSSKYKNIDFPLSNLTYPRDINFKFSFIYVP